MLIDQSDIVIVGAGIVGAALAQALARTGKTILVLDAGQPTAGIKLAADVTLMPSVADFDSRVSAFTAASRQLFQNLGVWRDIETTRACPFTHMSVWDAEGTGRIDFDAKEIKQPFLGYIAENALVIGVVQNHLASQSNVKLQFGAKLVGIEHDAGQIILMVEVAGEVKQLTTSLLVGADGANSQTRRLAAIPTREWGYQHHAIVTTVKCEQHHQFTAWQRFIDSGPLAFLPLQANAASQQQFCSIVWSMPPDAAESVMALSDQAFRLELAKSFEYRLGDILESSRRFQFPLRQRHAKYYVKPGLALVGDAAHTIHPLAGQGANLGLSDVAVLADELIQAAKAGIELGNPIVLERYQRRRMAPNLAMMGVMEGFKRLFSEDDIGVRWVRNAGMKWLNRLPLVKNEIISQAMGLNIKMPALN
ncbi:MAG: 2-octaprenyl-3-methyl-6-methoxy-1,4-benzoquinol hydroxylase [Gammaproteobacteria bacterium]|nr:MAG: 2-octaprenyl-3-methyl-6-methoxy-1,4-benzoquinol hydroxylase [Gammaproteobacteria bacterium]